MSTHCIKFGQLCSQLCSSCAQQPRLRAEKGWYEAVHVAMQLAGSVMGGWSCGQLVGSCGMNFPPSAAQQTADGRDPEMTRESVLALGFWELVAAEAR